MTTINYETKAMNNVAAAVARFSSNVVNELARAGFNARLVGSWEAGMATKPNADIDISVFVANPFAVDQATVSRVESITGFTFVKALPNGLKFERMWNGIECELVICQTGDRASSSLIADMLADGTLSADDIAVLRQEKRLWSTMAKDVYKAWKKGLAIAIHGLRGK